MGFIRDQLNKLTGRDDPAPISEAERWRRHVVRDGNLDYSGKPIDRNAGRPIAGRPDQRAYRERVDEFLERAGMQLESWTTRVPQLITDRQFDQEAKKAEQAHTRRFDDVNRGDADMQQFLQDGACDRGPKRRES
jgi:hypothetical protein